MSDEEAVCAFLFIVGPSVGKEKLLHFWNIVIVWERPKEILRILYRKKSFLHCSQNIGMTSSK